MIFWTYLVHQAVFYEFSILKILLKSNLNKVIRTFLDYKRSNKTYFQLMTKSFWILCKLIWSHYIFLIIHLELLKDHATIVLPCHFGNTKYFWDVSNPESLDREILIWFFHCHPKMIHGIDKFLLQSCWSGHLFIFLGVCRDKL